MKSTLAAIGGIVAVLILVTAITIGGYLLGWWIKKDSTNRTAEIYQDSYGRQTALQTSILDKIAEVQDPRLPEGQRSAIITVICRDYVLLSGGSRENLPFDTIQFLAKEC